MPLGDRIYVARARWRLSRVRPSRGRLRKSCECLQLEHRRRATGNSGIPPSSRTATATTTAPIEPGDRRQARLHHRGRGTDALPAIWRRRRRKDLRAIYHVRQDFRDRVYAARRRLVAARECRRAWRTVAWGWTGARDAKSGARARDGVPATRHPFQPWFEENGGCSSSRAAKPDPPFGGTAVDRPRHRTRGFRLSLAKPHAGIGQRLMPRRVRQQGPCVSELSDRERSSRCCGTSPTESSGLHSSSGCTSTRPLYRNGYFYGFDGRNEPDASLACVDAANGKIVWRETPEWMEVVGTERPDARTVRQHAPRIAARGGRPVPCALASWGTSSGWT